MFNSAAADMDFLLQVFVPGLEISVGFGLDT